MVIMVAAAGLALAPAGTLAQSAPGEASEAPAAETIGPRELQNFNLQGTVTREAEQASQPPAATPTPSRAAPSAETRTAAPATPPRPQATSEAPVTASAPPARERSRTTAPGAAPSTSSLTVQLPPAGGATAAPIAAAATTGGFADEPNNATLPSESGLPLWPWLLAAAALGAGGAFLFLRRGHQREAFAGGPQVDAFVVPEPPQPQRRQAPAPTPAKKPESRPAAPGLVSSSLRPWVEVDFQPLRCIIDDTRIRFEFGFELINSGGAPAREVLIEAKVINASAEQDRELAAFFANPTGKGDRIKAIAPLERMTLRPQIILPREQVRVLDAGGRKLFVPLIAFTALYRWGGGEGQTSAAYLIGRDSKGEKMAPLRLDFGARVFRTLAAKPLPIAVRK